MQTRVSKFFFLLFLGIFFSPKLALSQGVTERLNEADSLFNQRRFTQALEIYEEIAEVEQQASPAMMLRMAYIYEGLEDLSGALYYLDQYYKTTSNKKVLVKMQELADKNSLEGYETGDIDFILNFMRRFRFLLALVFVALGALILAMMLRKKKKHNVFSPGLTTGLVLSLSAVFYLVNLAGSKEKAIISSANAYLMTGPSAGSSLVEVVGEGHKVEIIDQQDVWTKIKWRGATAYIRENQLNQLP